MTTQKHTKLTRERVVNWLAVLVLLSLGIVWPPAFANTRGDDLKNVHAGTLLLRTSDGERVLALRQSTTIRAQVTGNVARVHVTQKFENPGDVWVEGLYVFPLSAAAAVDELEMIVGERRIRGEIKRKEEARATYEKAKSEGRRASLVDQERPNMFTTSVANIAPHSSITVDIAYLDTVPYRDGRYTLNLPLSITPRYTPGAPGDEAAPPSSMPSTATPEAVRPEMQTAQIEVDLLPGFAMGDVRSINHPADVSAIASGRRVTLQGSTIPADRDFELVWTPAAIPETEASAFAERFNGDTYVLVALTPPQMIASRAYKREVLFIIDTSGSMQGPSIEQAKAALQLGVQRLAPGDTFNIIRFSSDASSLFEAPRIADSEARSEAARYIGRLVADGGTEMRRALDMAFSMPSSHEALRQIVFVTDGSVSNEAELVKSIHERIDSARLFTVGIGAAPNAYFMREAAAAGRGSYTFIPNVNEVRARMEDVFRKLENPALIDLQVFWPGGVQGELATALPSDVYAGDPLVVVARLPKVPEGVLALTGRSGGGAWIRQLQIKSAGEQSGIAKLWARERIGELSRQKNFGGDAEELKTQIAGLALGYHLVSEYTSLVAVDVTPPVRPPEMEMTSLQAPTVAPVGGAWASPTTGFSSTATPAPMLWAIGLLGVGLAAWLWLSDRRKKPSAWRGVAGRSNHGITWRKRSYPRLKRLP
jgi:Ca-activated chloride channel family protein